MMETYRSFAFYLTLLSLLLLFMGLYRPWYVLWWEDRQNRKKVLKLYGSITLVTGLLYLVL